MSQALFQLLLAQSIIPIGTPVSLGTTANSANNTTQTIITLSTAILAGDLVCVAFANASNAAVTISGITDGTNTVYSSGTSVNNGAGGNDVELWYFPNAAAVASGSITINHTNSAGGAGQRRLATAWRVANTKTSSPLDVAASQAITTTASPTVASGTLAYSNEIAFGVAYQETAGTYTKPAGWTDINNSVSSLESLYTSYKIVSSTTTFNYNPTWSGSGTCGTLLCTFKGL